MSADAVIGEGQVQHVPFMAGMPPYMGFGTGVPPYMGVSGMMPSPYGGMVPPGLMPAVGPWQEFWTHVAQQHELQRQSW